MQHVASRTILEINKLLLTLDAKRLKKTHLEKVRFIKVSELKSTQFELFLTFHFMSVASIAFEWLRILA